MPVTPNSIVTPQGIRSSSGVATTSNSTSSDTPTNSVNIATAGPSGSRVTRITAIARASIVTNPTELQLFRDGDGTGTAKRLIRSKAMPVYGVSQTSGQPETDFGYSDANPLKLAAGEKLWAAIGVSNTGIVFNVELEDY